VDVAETAGGYRDVQHRYLDVAVDLGPLAVQAGFAQAVTSVERPIPTYLEEIRWQVARLPV
jgi:hypothetical protein